MTQGYAIQHSTAQDWFLHQRYDDGHELLRELPKWFYEAEQSANDALAFYDERNGLGGKFRVIRIAPHILRCKNYPSAALSYYPGEPPSIRYATCVVQIATRFHSKEEAERRYAEYLRIHENRRVAYYEYVPQEVISEVTSTRKVLESGYEIKRLEADDI